MLFFQWLRAAVRNAVLSGVQDALQQLDQVATDNPTEEPVLRLSVTVAQPEAKRLKGGKSA
jgi:hypothetical protein